MKRELPTYIIEGTEFIVDVSKLALREKTNPENAIHFSQMRDLGDHYLLSYSLADKNLPSLFTDGSQIISVPVPSLVKLDPEGMAIRFGNGQQIIDGKSDFDLMVDQDVLKQRLSGMLPTVDIAGHTFYVDVRMDMLRPKDDFQSQGIPFRAIDHCYDEEKHVYVVPYNPKTHEFQEIDGSKITAIPTDIIAVEIPHENKLDPVGMNRKQGLEETADLKFVGLRANFTAKVIDWKSLGIEEIITKNLSNIKNSTPIKEHKCDASRRQRRGPKM